MTMKILLHKDIKEKANASRKLSGLTLNRAKKLIPFFWEVLFLLPKAIATPIRILTLKRIK